MTEETKPVAADAGATITEEQLRKAEEYIEAEEGAANRLAGWAGIIVTGIAVACTLSRSAGVKPGGGGPGSRAGGRRSTDASGRRAPGGSASGRHRPRPGTRRHGR